MVKISPESVTGPEQGKTSGRIATIILWTGMLQNKCTNYKGVKNNTNIGQITGIQEKLDITFKPNASK